MFRVITMNLQLNCVIIINIKIKISKHSHCRPLYYSLIRLFYDTVRLNTVRYGYIWLDTVEFEQYRRFEFRLLNAFETLYFFGTRLGRLGHLQITVFYHLHLYTRGGQTFFGRNLLKTYFTFDDRLL